MTGMPVGAPSARATPGPGVLRRVSSGTTSATTTAALTAAMKAIHMVLAIATEKAWWMPSTIWPMNGSTSGCAGAGTDYSI